MVVTRGPGATCSCRHCSLFQVPTCLRFRLPPALLSNYMLLLGGCLNQGQAVGQQSPQSLLDRPLGVMLT